MRAFSAGLNSRLAAAHERLGDRESALKALQAFLDRAAREMPGFPGRSKADWTPVLRRYLGVKHRADYDIIDPLLDPIWNDAG